jgi:Protein of unknown function (DUF4435)/AAA domain, putative AbiEii toxin, Type IV TA system
MTTSDPIIRSITLPKINGTQEAILTSRNLLFVGANGAGKTRLGTWFEFSSPERAQVLRISAQKSLSMPDSTTPMSIDLAERILLFGHPTDMGNKAHYKFQNKPATSQLNDFEKLMVFLFSDETEQNAKYKSAQREATQRIHPPLTRLDLIKNAWEKVLPHRELVIGGLRIQTQVRGDPQKIYNSSEMSDGERVIFYLLGQCMAAPANGIIVVDEPELHLHKSVQTPLWAEVERLRPDCLFVYLTHDVDFAAAQHGAQKVWLKAFDGTAWDWEMIVGVDYLPDELLIEVLGSRKPVVFVEGEAGSDDVSLYREILPQFLVIPRGSCSQVIQSTKALRSNSHLHRLTVYGLVDRDRMLSPEIQALEADGIFTLEVAEVENLFCTKEILEIVSKRLERNATDDFSAITTFVFSKLKSEIDTQISLRVVAEIKFRLNLFDANAMGSQALNTALSNLVNGVDVDALYTQFAAEFNAVIEAQDYSGLLRIYNRKSMASQICGALGLKAGELTDLVIRLARTSCAPQIRSAVGPYLGNFANVET